MYYYDVMLIYDMTPLTQNTFFSGVVRNCKGKARDRFQTNFSCLSDRYFRCFDGARNICLYPRVQTDNTRHDVTMAR